MNQFEHPRPRPVRVDASQPSKQLSKRTRKQISQHLPFPRRLCLSSSSHQLPQPPPSAITASALDPLVRDQEADPAFRSPNTLPFSLLNRTTPIPNTAPINISSTDSRAVPPLKSLDHTSSTTPFSTDLRHLDYDPHKPIRLPALSTLASIASSGSPLR